MEEVEKNIGQQGGSELSGKEHLKSFVRQEKKWRVYKFKIKSTNTKRVRNR